jgi:tRNA-binding EMAP/Myf-like protein
MIVITSGAVVGKVVKVEDHPRAQRIRLAHVDLGDGGGPVQIVFGGPPVVEPENLVAVAPPGARVVSARTAKKMRRRNYRGEPSHGMLCSLDELGWAVGAPDEVAILRNVRAGDSLDRLSLRRRASIVESPRPKVGWPAALTLWALLIALRSVWARLFPSVIG